MGHPEVGCLFNFWIFVDQPDTPICYLSHANKVQEINLIAWPSIQWGLDL